MARQVLYDVALREQLRASLLKGRGHLHCPSSKLSVCGWLDTGVHQRAVDTLSELFESPESVAVGRLDPEGERLRLMDKKWERTSSVDPMAWITRESRAAANRSSGYWSS